MDYEERSSLVRRITSGKLYGSIVYNDRVYDVVFCDPSLSVMTESDWIYKSEFKKLTTETIIPTTEEYYKVLIEEGKWNNDLEIEMKKLQNDIIELTGNLNKLKFNKSATRNIKAAIDKGKKRLEELHSIKNQYTHFSAEFLAEKARKRFIISKISKLLCNSELIDNPLFKDSLIVYYFEESNIPESKIRELARTDPWRLYWTTSKDTGTPLFPYSVVEITKLQEALIMWSKCYDFAYNSTNRPTDDVIADDDRFDAWFKSELERIDKETKQNQISDISSGNQEIFIPADEEGAKEVYSLNSSSERNIIKSRESFIRQKGEVKDQALPDVSRGIKMQLNKMTKESIKNRSS